MNIDGRKEYILLQSTSVFWSIQNLLANYNLYVKELIKYTFLYYFCSDFIYRYPYPQTYIHNMFVDFQLCKWEFCLF